MKIILLVSTILVIVHCNPLTEEWLSFKAKYGKNYEDPNEDQRRMEIFSKTMEYINNHNQKYLDDRVSFTMGINEFADLTDEEFEKFYLGKAQNSSNSGEEDIGTHNPPESLDGLPDSVDWRSEGCVTPVKYQGQCGSYWTFSTIGAVEGQNYRKTGRLVSLSEQNLLDCSSNIWYGNNGCNGGYMFRSYKYIKKNGIDTEESYPYDGKVIKCRFNNETIGANITGYIRVKKDSQYALQDAVANVGPVAVGLEVYKSFRYYNGGVYYDAQCGTSLQNHAALVVGYGTEEDGKDYWLVKNSWGTHWGLDGYIKMIRNFPTSCGILVDATYPTM